MNSGQNDRYRVERRAERILPQSNDDDGGGEHCGRAPHSGHAVDQGEKSQLLSRRNQGERASYKWKARLGHRVAARTVSRDGKLSGTFGDRETSSAPDNVRGCSLPAHSTKWEILARGPLKSKPMSGVASAVSGPPSPVGATPATATISSHS